MTAELAGGGVIGPISAWRGSCSLGSPCTAILGGAGPVPELLADWYTAVVHGQTNVYRDMVLRVKNSAGTVLASYYLGDARPETLLRQSGRYQVTMSLAVIEDIS